jgi:hypothetical protein
MTNLRNWHSPDVSFYSLYFSKAKPICNGVRRIRRFYLYNIIKYLDPPARPNIYICFYTLHRTQPFDKVVCIYRVYKQWNLRWQPSIVKNTHVVKLLKCKTNTIPILMHQMRISTNQVSSVVLWPKKLEIRKIVKTAKEPKKPNTLPWNWAKSVEG